MCYVICLIGLMLQTVYRKWHNIIDIAKKVNHVYIYTYKSYY